METAPQKSVLQSIVDIANSEKQAAEQENATANENQPADDTPQQEQENAQSLIETPVVKEPKAKTTKAPKKVTPEPVVAADGGEAEVKKAVLSIFDEQPTEEGEEQDQTDYKSLVEELQSKLGRYNKPFIDNLLDAMESPDFEAEKFFESFKPKDFKDMPVEQLWKMKKNATSNIEYTEDELNDLWEDEIKSIEDSLPEGRRIDSRLKAMKDALITELRPKVKLDDEPEYMKGLKLSAAERKEAQAKNDEIFNNMLSASLKKAESYLGGTVVGDLKVSDKHIEEVKRAIDPTSGYYKKADGSFDEDKLVREKLAAIVLKDVLAEHKKIVTAETKKDILRPNANAEGSVYAQSDVSPEDEALSRILKQDYLKPKK